MSLTGVFLNVCQFNTFDKQLKYLQDNYTEDYIIYFALKFNERVKKCKDVYSYNSASKEKFNEFCEYIVSIGESHEFIKFPTKKRYISFYNKIINNKLEYNKCIFSSNLYKKEEKEKEITKEEEIQTITPLIIPKLNQSDTHFYFTEDNDTEKTHLNVNKNINKIGKMTLNALAHKIKINNPEKINKSELIEIIKQNLTFEI